MTVVSWFPPKTRPDRCLKDSSIEGAGLEVDLEDGIRDFHAVRRKATKLDMDPSWVM